MATSVQTFTPWPNIRRVAAMISTGETPPNFLLMPRSAPERAWAAVTRVTPLSRRKLAVSSGMSFWPGSSMPNTWRTTTSLLGKFFSLARATSFLAVSPVEEARTRSSPRARAVSRARFRVASVLTPPTVSKVIIGKLLSIGEIKTVLRPLGRIRVDIVPDA